MEGVQFGLDGPVMSGTWFNPKTGDTFTVRDAFIEDNVYKISTMDGRSLTLEYINNQGYIQAQDGFVPQKVEQAPPPQISNESLLKGIDTDDDPSLIEALGSAAPQEMQRPQQPTVKIGNLRTDEPASRISELPNTAFIEKMLGKEMLPPFEITVHLEDFPSKKIETLRDMMDVDMKEILEWYVEKYNTEEIRTQLTCSLADVLSTFVPKVEKVEVKFQTKEKPVIKSKPTVKKPAITTQTKKEKKK